MINIGFLMFENLAITSCNRRFSRFCIVTVVEMNVILKKFSAKCQILDFMFRSNQIKVQLIVDNGAQCTTAVHFTHHFLCIINDFNHFFHIHWCCDLPGAPNSPATADKHVNQHCTANQTQHCQWKLINTEKQNATNRFKCRSNSSGGVFQRRMESAVSL